MKEKITKILRKKFKHSSFRIGQEKAILSILQGNDTLVMLPTGVGKSLCYQLPAYLLKGTVLVVSPLLSLMQDQVENLKSLGEKKVVALNSETSFFERERIFKKINEYRFIYTSPEMLQNVKVLQALKSLNISIFVVDEAHCISHWGTDFRPDYLDLREIREELNSPKTMALTATATKEVREEIIYFLSMDKNKTEEIIKSVDRPEIKFIVKHSYGNKNKQLKYYLNRLKGPGIIYFMSKKLADQWSLKLNNELGIRSASYHSDIEGDDKNKIQKQFLNNDLEVICATSAFGMGFDKKDIRFIIHFHLPGSVEMYLQEVGRASRDGKDSLAILLYQPGDEKIQERFIESSLPTYDLLRKINSRKKVNSDVELVMIKLAKHYLDLSDHLDEAWSLINERKKIKEKQLSFMLEYIYEKKCKRTKLLEYFGEDLKNNIERCCSFCGLEEKMLIEKLNKLKKDSKNELKLHQMSNWETIFNSLYDKN